MRIKSDPCKYILKLFISNVKFSNGKHNFHEYNYIFCHYEIYFKVKLFISNIKFSNNKHK